MPSVYGLDTRDKNAAWIFCAADLAFFLVITLTSTQLRAGLSFWAPLILIVGNVVIASFVFRDSKRKSITFLLAAWIGVLAGTATGLFYFLTEGASTPSDHEAGVIPAGLIFCWTVPLIVMVTIYIVQLRARGE